MPETLYQGGLDVFLAKVRADFDAVEDQSLRASRALQDYSLVGTESMGDMLYTEISETTEEGDRAVWRHVGTTGAKDLGTRQAGGEYPAVDFLRNYETAVYDPNNQNAGEFKVPEEREAKEGNRYKQALNRAQKLLTEIDRFNIKDPFESFNLAFTDPSSFPTSGDGGGRFFVRGNRGLDGNYSALGERLISTQHSRADGGTTISNAVTQNGNARPFNDNSYWAAREQGATFKDDVGKEMPMFGGEVDIIVPPANNLVRTAKEINESDLEVETADNNINIQKGRLGRIISSPYMLQSQYVSGTSNKNQWFLVDRNNRDPEVGTGLVCINFVPLESRVERDQDVDSIVYKVKQEKSYGWVDWRSVVGSPGTGASYTS